MRRRAGRGPRARRDPGRGDRPAGAARSGASGRARWPKLFFYPGRAGGAGGDRDRAGARGRAGGALGPVRAVDRGLPDGGPRHSRRGGAAGQPGGGRRARARPHADPRPAARSRAGATGRGGKAARPARRRERRVPPAGAWRYYLAVQGDRVRHLDGCLPPDQLLQAAWEASRGRRAGTIRRRRVRGIGVQVSPASDEASMAFRRTGGRYEAALGFDRRGGGHLVPERRLAAAARRGQRRQRLSAGAAVRRRAGPRERLLRRFHRRDRPVRSRHARHARAAQGSLLGPPHRRRLQGAHRADLGQLRRARHPDRRAGRLDHGGRAAARDPGRARGCRDRAIRSSRSTASPPRAGRTTRRSRRSAATPGPR